MCSIPANRRTVLILSFIKLAFSLYIFAMGIFICDSLNLQRAYGSIFILYGFSLLCMGIISTGVVFMHWYANKRHNRFLLLLSFILDGLVFLIVLSTSTTMRGYMTPEFSKDLQLDCLRNTPLEHTQAECEGFYDADRTAGFRLFWMGLFDNFGQIQNRQAMVSIQGDTCCGFYGPKNCISNNASFPPGYSQIGIDTNNLRRRVTCGFKPTFYPAQADCTDFFDAGTENQIVGGCDFDFGTGFCLDNEVDANSIGCASSVEDYVADIIDARTTVLIVAALLHVLTMMYSGCMYCKRKESDVFPEVGQGIVDVDFQKIRDEFEVVPDRDALQRLGFLPKEKRGTNEERKDEQQSKENGENKVEERGPNDVNGDVVLDNLIEPSSPSFELSPIKDDSTLNAGRSSHDREQEGTEADVEKGSAEAPEGIELATNNQEIPGQNP